MLLSERVLGNGFEGKGSVAKKKKKKLIVSLKGLGFRAN
jgi:hypothetical protein